MRIALTLLAGLTLAQTTSTDVAFRLQKLDDGLSETAAIADINGDGRLDIVSSESWYEAPTWTKRAIRTIPVTNGYVDNFSDLPIDVDGDGFTDLIQIAYFGRRIIWVKNPGKTGGPWAESEIDAVGPTEFAFLVDLNNDGRANDLLPQFTGAAQTGLTWYELQNGKWVKHLVSQRSYGHGIGAGDINGDKRTDIITPLGWLEAPADVRAPGEWTFHATDWSQPKIPIGVPPAGSAPPAVRPAVPAMRVTPTPTQTSSASSRLEAVSTSSRLSVEVRGPNGGGSFIAEVKGSPAESKFGLDVSGLGIRTQDGRQVRGLMFSGWLEGSGVHVAVSALPEGGQPGSTDLLEFATYTMQPGQTQRIQTAGDGITVRVLQLVLMSSVPNQAPQPPPVRVEYGFMYVLDINGDGRNDILTTMGHSFGVLWIEQKADGTWEQHLIDNTWSRAHASALADVNGDGRPDLITGTRFMGRNANETEPLAMYWYEFTRTSSPATVTWTRHAISTGGDSGSGLQTVAVDIDKDGDIDVVSGGKSGLFFRENLTKNPPKTVGTRSLTLR